MKIPALSLFVLATLSACDMNSAFENQVYVGELARKPTRELGLQIPPDVQDLFYCNEGFIDPTQFVSFSVSPAEAESIVREYAKVGFSKFSKWENQISASSGTREPGRDSEKDRSPLYDVDSLKDAMIYTYQSKDLRSGYHFIYDSQTQKLYFCYWIG